MKNRNELIEEAIRFIDETGGSYTPELMADFILQHPEVRALESLRETVGMDCERCPAEVQEALHKIPEIQKTHYPHPIREPETRMARLVRQS